MGIEEDVEALTHSDEDEGSEQAPVGFYADDVPFRSGVVWHQAPLHMAYTAALNGFNPPRPEGHFRYCDLGCGNGMTLNAYAALYPEAEFVGIDFNAGHIADARAQAERLGLENVRFIQGSFADIDRTALPYFDFMAMNGIYSWLDRDIQPAVIDLVRQQLKPGGLFYVEYMCMPGMVAVIPLWHLMQALTPDRGEGSRERATRALRLLEELYNSGMSYLDRHPTAQNAAKGYAASWRTNENQIDHFAHNAMASGFRPRFFNEMSGEMADAGLVFGGRTNIMLNDPDLAVTLQQAGILNGIEDRTIRELLLDYMRNERNRRDVFVKESKPDIEGAHDFLLNEIRYIDRNPSGTPPPVLNLPGSRQMNFSGGVYECLKTAFDGKAATLREADPNEEISGETLLTAGHRLAVTGRYFVCRPGFEGGPLPDAPDQLRMPDAVNRERLADAAKAMTGVSILSKSVGNILMGLGPLEIVLLNAWCAYGRHNALAAALNELAQSDKKLQVNQKTINVADLTEADLVPRFNQLANIRVPNMLRMGALERV